MDFKPDSDDCKRFMRELLINCDADTPMNWKSGDNMQVRKEDFIYQWQPTALRQAPMGKPWGGCDKTYKVAFDRYVIWGAGWLNSNFGRELRDKVESKSISLTGWNFNHGLSDDGRE